MKIHLGPCEYTFHGVVLYCPIFFWRFKPLSSCRWRVSVCMQIQNILYVISEFTVWGVEIAIISFQRLLHLLEPCRLGFRNSQVSLIKWSFEDHLGIVKKNYGGLGRCKLKTVESRWTKKPFVSSGRGGWEAPRQGRSWRPAAMCNEDVRCSSSPQGCCNCPPGRISAASWRRMPRRAWWGSSERLWRRWRWRGAFWTSISRFGTRNRALLWMCTMAIALLLAQSTFSLVNTSTHHRYQKGWSGLHSKVAISAALCPLTNLVLKGEI